LAAINYTPRGGKTGLDNCRQFESRIVRAVEKKADLAVLGECITSVGTPMDRHEAAEPIPGPSSRYLAQLADQYNIFIVTTLYERLDHRIFNTAILLDPEGNLLGTYRKICPARPEYREGVAPGNNFPVFDTKLGKIGLMICFDVHMPPVTSRQIRAEGAPGRGEVQAVT
jgi:predicted amidohydrolase